MSEETPISVSMSCVLVWVDYKMESTPTFKSKYYKTWKEYKALHPEVSDFGKEKLQGLEEAMFTFVINLFI